MYSRDYHWKPAYVLANRVVSRLTPVRHSKLTFGLCARHRRQKIMVILGSIALMLAGLAEILLAGHFEKAIWSLLGIAMIVGAAILWSFVPSLSPHQTLGDLTGYVGAGTPFLKSLPDLPSSAG